MKIYFVKLALIIFPFIFIVQSNNWKVESSEISFAIKFLGNTVNGTFGGLIADIRFDPLKPEEAKIKASIDVNTIETGINLRNKDLKADFFQSDKYPTITMQSTKIERTGPITYDGTFLLHMKDVTKEIKFPFVFVKTPDKTEFKGSFTVNRFDFGVGEKRKGMADEVAITISVLVSENTASAKE